MKRTLNFYLRLLTITSLHQLVVGPSEKSENRLSAGRSIEKSLMYELLERYKVSGKIGRPVKSAKEQIRVTFGLSLIQILDLDENKQILSTNCWLRYEWTDELLNWTELNNTDFNSITEIRVYPDEIWIPDIKLYNFADERLQENRDARVVVGKIGNVYWVPQALFKSTCPVEISTFPFDTQICELSFGSWTYDKTQLFLNWTEGIGEYIDLTDYMKSNEWTTNGEKDKKLQIRSCKDTTNLSLTINNKQEFREYEILRYRVRITRNPTFYVCILILPCILLSCLTLVVFWLPPESSAKMVLGMNIFVAFFVLLLLLAESTPSAVKNFPLIGCYYCLNMALITLSTFLASTVINLYFKGDQKGPVPPRIRKFLIDGMGRLMLIRQTIPLTNDKKLVRAIVGEKSSQSGTQCNNGRNVTLSTMRYNRFQISDAYTDRNSMKCAGDRNSTVETEDSPIISSYNSPLEKDVREIKRYIQMYVSRQKERNRKNMLAMEWRTMALVLDRMFFVVYVVTICTALITILPRPGQMEGGIQECR